MVPTKKSKFRSTWTEDRTGVEVESLGYDIDLPRVDMHESHGINDGVRSRIGLIFEYAD